MYDFSLVDLMRLLKFSLFSVDSRVEVGASVDSTEEENVAAPEPYS